jgi:hypothetical protein
MIFHIELCKSYQWHTRAACVNAENQISFIIRKDVPTQNIMDTYSFDMQFIFV